MAEQRQGNSPYARYGKTPWRYSEAWRTWDHAGRRDGWGADSTRRLAMAMKPPDVQDKLRLYPERYGKKDAGK